MTPIHILWSKPMKEKDKLYNFCMMLLSALMVKELYGRVELITDWNGKYLAKELGLPYDYIHTGLDYVDTDKSFPTAKVYAYKLIAEYIPNFLYLDYDVFMTKKIPNKESIIQTDEGLSMHPYAIYYYCLERGFEFPFEYAKEDLRFYNMGLFKASKKIVNEYHDTYFSTIYKNQHLHDKSFYLDQYTMFLEQNLIYMVLKNNNKLKDVYEHYPLNKQQHNKYTWNDTPEKIRENKSYVGEMISKYAGNDESKFGQWFDTPANIEAISKTDYIHLAHYKMIPKVNEDVMAYGFNKYPKQFAQLINRFKNI